MNKTFSKISGLLLSLFFLTGSPSWAQGPLKMGVLDAKRCIEQTEAGKKIYTLFKEKSAREQRELDEQTNALKKLQEDYTKKNEILSAEARREKEKELLRKEEDLRDRVREKNTLFQKEEGEAFQKLTEEIFQTVAAIGKEQGYSLILEAKSGVVYFNPANDLTDQVIKRHNAKK
jgi:outer membrane protein